MWSITEQINSQVLWDLAITAQNQCEHHTVGTLSHLAAVAFTIPAPVFYWLAHSSQAWNHQYLHKKLPPHLPRKQEYECNHLLWMFGGITLVCQISRGHRMNHCIMKYQWDIGVQLEIFCLFFFFLTGMLSDTLQKMPSFPEKYEIPGKKRKIKKTPTPNTHTQVSGIHTTLILAP